MFSHWIQQEGRHLRQEPARKKAWVSQPGGHRDSNWAQRSWEGEERWGWESAGCSERSRGNLDVTHQRVNSIHRAFESHCKYWCCPVRRNSRQAAFFLHRACVLDRVMPHHNSTRPFHSIFKPLKQSAWSWLERTICCCRQQARTTFHVKASKPRPPRWPATHFYVFQRPCFTLKASIFLRHFHEPRVQPSRHWQAASRLILVLQNKKPCDAVSPSDRLNFAVLCLECQEQAVSNSSWGLRAVWGSGSLLFVSLCSLCFFFHFTPRSLGKNAPAWLPSPGLSTTELAQLNFSHTQRTEHRGEVRSWVLQTRVLVSALLFSCCAS